MAPGNASSELERIIPPEIVDDEFHRLIGEIARKHDLKHVLEIGSSAGGGSTKAFVQALRANPHRPSLYCMEVSKARFDVLSRRYRDETFVRCFNVSSVPVRAFSSEAEVTAFYNTTPTTLNKYPLEQVLGWLRQDIEYVRDAAVPEDGIASMKLELGIDAFDMVLIDGSEFTGAAELDRVYGSTYILLDDTNAFKCYHARERLLADPDYELIADNQRLRNGYSAFRRRIPLCKSAELPIHFFTIVLNGEPFIRYHMDAFQKLRFPWHWHIVEGVASLVHDTAWSVGGGGRIDASLHENGRSNDGTSAYLDEIACAHPNQITLYRKRAGEFWDGKLEMVSAPLAHLPHDCLLWQIDADELWTPHQITAVREKFLAEPDRSAAMFWCLYFVGPRALVSTRYNYAQNPDHEWQRVWRFRAGDRWAAHEPPTLVRRIRGRCVDVAHIAPLSHDETEALGAVFQHFAYVTPEQLHFKEVYYGYDDAQRRWRDLQIAVARAPGVLLKEYFPWVTDETMVETVETLGVRPIATCDADGRWTLKAPEPEPEAALVKRPSDVSPRIVVDAVFFQHNQRSGIARVWRAILREWRASGFHAQVTILDRAGTAPRVPGYRYRSIAARDDARSGADAFLLQRICDEEGADLFISTYYTSPIRTPSVFLAHDFIPERFDQNLEDQNWREKRHALEHAAFVICVSEATRRDLLHFFPRLEASRCKVIHNAADTCFSPASANDIQAFRQRHAIVRAYFLMVGERIGHRGYKDGMLFLRALRAWPRGQEFDVVCVGGSDLEPEFEALTFGLQVRKLDLSDEELRVAYSGAQALVYPSRIEGFGLPVLEAMACGCPVVAARAFALQEVGGEAPFYFEPGNVEGLRAALDRQADDNQRSLQIAIGIEQAQRFSWSAAGEAYARTMRDTADAIRVGTIERPSPLWQTLRAEQARNQAEIAEMRRHWRIRATGGLTSALARSPLRPALFAARGWLLERLPAGAIPAARRAWRVLMGVRTESGRA